MYSLRAAATGKARRPIVKSLTAGTIRLSATEERSLCREGMSAVRVHCLYWNCVLLDDAIRYNAECLLCAKELPGGYLNLLHVTEKIYKFMENKTKTKYIWLFPSLLLILLPRQTSDMF